MAVTRRGPLPAVQADDGPWFMANSLGAGFPWLGGTVRVCGGRREPILGGLVAASMRLTPPQTRPDPPLTVCRCHGRAKAHLERDALALLWFWLFPWQPTDSGGSAGAGLRDRRKHGCFLRAPMDGFTACPANPHRSAQLRPRLSYRLFARLREAVGLRADCQGSSAIPCRRSPDRYQNSRLSISRVLPMRAAIRATRLPSSLSAGSDRSGLRTTA